MAEAGGHFWMGRARGVAVEGALSWGSGAVNLRLFAPIKDPAVRQYWESPTTLKFEVDPDESVRNARQCVIYGRLEDGTAVTFLDARLEGDWPVVPQEFTGHRLLVGAFVKDRDALVVTGARWTVGGPDPGWMLNDPVDDHGVRFSAWSNHGDPGLCLEFDERVSVRDAGELLPTRISALTQNAYGRHAHPLVREVRTTNGRWCQLGTASKAKSNGALLIPGSLDLATVTRWHDVAKSLGRVAIVPTVRYDPMEIEVLVNTIAFEGLHRRLKGRSYRVTRDDGTVGEPRLKERIAELGQHVEEIVPGLFAPDVASCAARLARLRNDESHLEDRTDDMSEEHIRTYNAYRLISRWALRVLLLRQVMTPDAIRAGIDPEGGLLLALAHMDEEGRWPDYSAYETFIRARPDLLNRRTDDNDRAT